ncbi:MAG: DUF1800 domain-containing protein [Microcoleaceae cyanobacterium]
MADKQVFHLINRISLGPKKEQIQLIEKQGIDGYIQAQLQPKNIPYPAELKQKLQPLETLRFTPNKAFKERQRIEKTADELTLSRREKRRARRQLENKTLLQARQGRSLLALESPRQLEEVMVDFWYNHFNVYAKKSGITRILFSSYEQQVIRPHALGKFRQILGATAHHPAMLHYLDNWQNTDPKSKNAKGRFKGINENYARELLELHTLGVDGGYSQQDVMELARILTGWGLPDNPKRSTDEDGFYFDSDRHDFTDKILLGKTIKGRGIAEGEEALDLLASHPSTAKFISYKIAQLFIADYPPESIIKKLSQRFLETEGNIAAVLKTVFKSDEFWDKKYYNSKFKSPYRYMTSVMRAIGTVSNYKRIDGLLNQLGMPLYECATPEGYKNTEDAWLSPDTMIRRSSLSLPFSNGLLHDSKPIDKDRLSQTLEGLLSTNTLEVIDNNPPNLKAALMLGCPEFMRY